MDMSILPICVAACPVAVMVAGIMCKLYRVDLS